MLIGYARVSTVDQNLALQRDALTEAGCAKIFTEQMSGAVTDRPALHDALEFARSGDTLIVWKLDRLARSMKQLIETVETLRVRGIGFRSLTEVLDTTTAQGRLVFHMFGALAEFERSLIRERTQAGHAAARRAGRTGGRPPKLTDDETCPAPTPVYHFLMRRRRASRIFTVSPITSRPPDNVDRSSTLGSWGCRSASRRCTGGFAKLVAGNVENGKAPTLLWKRLEIRLDKNLNRLVAGINLNTNRRIAKVHLVASSVHSSNDGVGHYRLAPESLAQNSVE